MHFDVDANTIFLAITGSHAYGMARAGSDVDVRGVCVQPMSVRLSYLKRFEQYQGPLSPGLCELVRQKQAWSDKPDESVTDNTIYDLAKTIKLIADNNPNMLELLWLPEEQFILSTSTWMNFVGIREKFLSRKCKFTFMGYAHAQYRKIASQSTRSDPSGGILRDDSTPLEDRRSPFGPHSFLEDGCLG